MKRFLITASAAALALTATTAAADDQPVWLSDAAGQMYQTIGNIDPANPQAALAQLQGCEIKAEAVIFDSEGTDTEANGAEPQGTRYSCKIGFGDYVALLVRNQPFEGAKFELGAAGGYSQDDAEPEKVGWFWLPYDESGKPTLGGIWEEKHAPTDNPPMVPIFAYTNPVGKFLASVDKLDPENPTTALAELECALSPDPDRVAIIGLSHTAFPENAEDAVGSQWSCPFGLADVFVIYLDEEDRYGKQFSIVINYPYKGVTGDYWASYDAEGIKTLKAVHTPKKD